MGSEEEGKERGNGGGWKEVRNNEGRGKGRREKTEKGEREQREEEHGKKR